MPEERLEDGATCHANVLSFNPVSDNTCLTCTQHGPAAIEAYVDGVRDYTARYDVTDGEVPDWYHRSDISTRLPRQFLCDVRYRNAPIEHAPADAPRHLRISLNENEYSPNSTLAYWAADGDGSTVREAHVAYGNTEKLWHHSL